jgi:hypothetical protein
VLRTLAIYALFVVLWFQLARAVLRLMKKRLTERFLDPKKPLKAERDPYFNREYARRAEPSAKGSKVKVAS